MTTKPPAQTPFDDEISLLDMIQFFKDNLRGILFFVMIGGILGGILGKILGPVYEGSMLIAPAKVAGNFVVDPKITLTKLEMNSYYPKETFLVCNPKFYKDKYKDKDKDIDYDMSDIVKTSITRDGALLSLKMYDRDKSVIKNCLESVESNIQSSQHIIAEPIIEMKKNEMILAQNKLQISEDFRNKLNDKQLKDLKTNELRFSTDVLYANIVLSNASEIKALMDQLNKLKTDLSSEQTKEAGKVLPINIEKRKFPSLSFGVLLGVFLGFFLGIMFALIKQSKI
jgi:hypothetical protein